MSKIKDFPLLPSVPSGGYVVVTQPTGRDANGDPLSVFAKVPATTLGTGGGGGGSSLTLDDAMLDDLGIDITHAAGDDLGVTLINLALDDIPSGSSGGSTASDDNIINVRDHGAMADGVTNDTAAVQAALDAVPAAGGTVLLPGMCLISNVVFIKSLTRLTGVGPGSGLLAAASLPPNTGGPTGATSTGAMLCNQNYTATSITDHDIVVENMSFDFGAHANALADHALRFYRTRNVVIDQVTFQVRGCGDATALIGCDNVLTQACSAFDWTNCAYDHWWAPKNIRVLGCYGKTASTTGQVVNFNPDHHPPDDPAGYVADTLVVADCTFDMSAAATAIPLMLEPLAAGAFARNITVSNNTFLNGFVAVRGANANVVISGNTFCKIRGGWPAVMTYTNFGGVPSNHVVTGNVIEDPDTTTAVGSAVLRIWCDHAVIANNCISGTGFTAPALDTGSFVVTAVGNSFPSGASTNATLAVPGILALNMPIGTVTPNIGLFTDLHSHQTYIDGPASAYRILSFTTNGSARWNVFAEGGAEGGGNTGGNFYISRYDNSGGGLGASLQINRSDGGVQFAAPYITTTGDIRATNGLRCGAQTVATTSDLSKHLDLYNGTFGINVDTGGTMNHVSGASGQAFYVGGTRGAVITASGIIGTNIGAVGPGTGAFTSLTATIGLGVWGVTPPLAKTTITGSRGSATATVLASLLTALAATGLIADGTTA